ncbi:MAG: aminotransferase class V-fold PLP-dependent enzyme, partial [Planctomycetes bacterium]|nr:aminotransferase class V-fold PLP-dependent enzyme [Planctomycetota bacterium]
NLVGTINPIQEICQLAHSVGAQVFLDCVHYAPHRLPSVDEWGCDWLACSAYKFFGPHVGVLWGRPQLLQELQPYKLRPVTENLPGRWMTGTQNHEGIAGTKAAIEYLTSLGRRIEPGAQHRRSLLQAAYSEILDYEQQLVLELLDGLKSISDIRILGITEPSQVSHRMPTVSFLHARRNPADVAEVLGRSGLFVGNGNFYALSLTESLGLEPNGVIRVGLMHYNTLEEIERLIENLKRL